MTVSVRVPGRTWGPPVHDARWSAEGLTAMAAHAAELGSAAGMVVHEGQVVTQWGDPSQLFNVASLRKTLLSALYGLHPEIDLRWTVGDLGIDDSPPALTEAEKRATLVDLLTLRSGIYHPANYEGDAAKAARPLRGSHPPGTYWYYNNWDANVLGTIFRQVTGTDIFEEFARQIAAPLGMEDYDARRCSYAEPDLDSLHRAYLFALSVRDLARFGLLYLRAGAWGERQVIPRAWIAQSVQPYALSTAGLGYGYFWEVAVEGRFYGDVRVEPGAFGFSGGPGHYLWVLPGQDLVVACQHHLDLPGRETLRGHQFGALLQSVLAARVC